MIQLKIKKIINYLLYLFFALFPFYTVLRFNGIPLELFIIGVLYIILLVKSFYKKKVVIPVTFFTSFFFLLIYFVLGDLLYSTINSRDLLIFIWGGVPLLLLNLIDNEIVLDKSLKLLFYSTSFLSILIVIEFFQIIDFAFIKFHTHKNGLIRLQGIGNSPNSNSFAIFIFIVLMISFKFYKKDSINNNMFYLILSSFLIFVIILCESRSLLLGIFISILMLLIWKGKMGKKMFKKIMKIFFIFLILFIFLVPNKLILKRIISSEFSNRTIRWNVAIDIWVISPIIGVGFESIKDITYENSNLERKNVHNAYLEFLAGTGLIGFFAFLIFLLNVYLLLYNFNLKSKNIYLYFIAITTFFIFNITHSMIFISSFWISLGFLEVEYYLTSRKTYAD